MIKKVDNNGRVTYYTNSKDTFWEMIEVYHVEGIRVAAGIRGNLYYMKLL